MANTTGLSNPSTSLAFLPPTLASQFEVSRYVYAATLGAYAWDIGLNLGNDYALLFKHRVRFPTIVYFFSRASTLAYILTFFIFQVAPAESCNGLAIGSSICIILLQTSTAMLFFVRVTAVWHQSKIAYVVFFILWVAVLGAGLAAPLGVRGEHIGPTAQCIVTVVPAYIKVAAITPLVNDTAIFLAITYRILAHTIVADCLGARLRIFFGGRGSSALSQALLRSGQHFYLVAVAANITLLALPHLSSVNHSMISVPAFAVVNAMACIVFWRIKFGLISSDGISNVPTIGLSNFHATVNPISLPLHSRHTDPTTTEVRMNAAFPLGVRMQSEVDIEDRADASEEISKPPILA
ncbi:hypothetical protein MSAN_02309900 [Mycena sanguinolenta]|uniref:Uncharacterized protein n=1 Tax=Mycena sanguinolenta TaxID=230812 RepID=A0A8H7CG02_9AGAR|nr:hypothetical protein MSAN_02309900 [Mycena sanguinolenta]